MLNKLLHLTIQNKSDGILSDERPKCLKVDVVRK